MPPSPTTSEGRRTVRVIGAYGADPAAGPDAVEQVGRLVSEGAPTWQIRSHFRKRADALTFIATWLSKRGAGDGPATGACPGCGTAGPAEPRPVAVTWEFYTSQASLGLLEAAELAFGRVPLPVSHVRHRFVTTHRLCDRCRRSAWRRVWGSKAVRVIGTTALLVGLAALAWGLVLVLVGGKRREGEPFLADPRLALAGAGVVVVSAVLLLWTAGWRVHPGLRPVGRREFRPIKIALVRGGGGTR